MGGEFRSQSREGHDCRGRAPRLLAAGPIDGLDRAHRQVSQPDAGERSCGHHDAGFEEIKVPIVPPALVPVVTDEAQ